MARDILRRLLTSITGGLAVFTAAETDVLASAILIILGVAGDALLDRARGDV